jgi:uncharacterized protein YodC (DUF2158 family)
MATAFKKGDVVSLKMVVPSGPVQALRMDEDGNVHYLISWVDADGVQQERWFEESLLVSGA